MKENFLYFLTSVLKGKKNHLVITKIKSLRQITTSTNTWCVQVLRSPKEAFAAAMQSWRERREKCVDLQGDYGEK